MHHASGVRRPICSDKNKVRCTDRYLVPKSAVLSSVCTFVNAIRPLLHQSCKASSRISTCFNRPMPARDAKARADVESPCTSGTTLWPKVSFTKPLAHSISEHVLPNA
jgi:hypothetical protein